MFTCCPKSRQDFRFLEMIVQILQTLSPHEQRGLFSPTECQAFSKMASAAKMKYWPKHNSVPRLKVMQLKLYHDRDILKVNFSAASLSAQPESLGQGNVTG